MKINLVLFFNFFLESMIFSPTFDDFLCKACDNTGKNLELKRPLKFRPVVARIQLYLDQNETNERATVK